MGFLPRIREKNDGDGIAHSHLLQYVSYPDAVVRATWAMSYINRRMHPSHLGARLSHYLCYYELAIKSRHPTSNKKNTAV